MPCPARPQHAKVASLEKQNRDLSWQVAMLTRGSNSGGSSGAGLQLPVSTQSLGIGGPPGSVAVPVGPAGGGEGGWRRHATLPGLLGLVLRYRRQLVSARRAALCMLCYWGARAARLSPPLHSSSHLPLCTALHSASLAPSRSSLCLPSLSVHRSLAT